MCVHIVSYAANGHLADKLTISHLVDKSPEYFLGTICKTVRPMLSDRCLSLLSVTLVYCG